VATVKRNVDAGLVGGISNGLVVFAFDETGDAVFKGQCNLVGHYGSLDVVDIDDVVDVVVLQNNLLLDDLRLLTADVDGEEGITEVHIGGVVTEVVGDPVEADIHFTVTLLQDLHV